MAAPKLLPEEQIRLLKSEIVNYKKLLNEVQKVAHVGHWEIDLLTEKVIWSEEAYRILGASKKMRSSLDSFLSFVHPEDLGTVNKIIEIHLRKLTNFHFCCRIIQKGGAVRHIYGEGRFEIDDIRKISRLHGIIHDVTELKRMQNKICLSEMQGQENERERLSKELHRRTGTNIGWS